MATRADVLARRRRPTALRRAVRRAFALPRWGPALVSVVMVLTSVLLAWLTYTYPAVVPWSVFIPVVVLAGLFLPPRFVALVFIAVAALMGYVGSLTAQVRPTFWGNLLITLGIGAVMGWVGLSRARLGVQGTLGESMLVDLRDRLRAHGELPELPEPWHAEVSLQSAYGDAFSGDFIVANRSDDGRQLEVALVDVSGKGLNAGTRALLLSGALGGLLGAMAPAQFLPAANSYLLRQDWNEGFATAIHVALNLETGDYSVGSAGHPPAVQFSAGSGLWELLDDRNGPILGVLDGVDFPRTDSRLERGDALLIYTDGVVETRTRDLTMGIDRMLGAAERLVSQGFVGGAARICAVALAGDTDDRAVVLIWRR